MGKYDNGEVILGTSNFNTVQKICEDALKNSKMVSIIGYPGAGKTTALKHFESINDTVYYIRVRPSMTAKQFYTKIIEVLGIEKQHNDIPLFHLIQKAAYVLNATSENKLLIMDEAGKFSRRMLEYLHELRDATMQTTGIVLAGPDYFHRNLLNWTAKELDGMPEVFRRINSWQRLIKPQRNEIQALCEAYGITDEKIIKDLRAACGNFGELRNRIMDLQYTEYAK